MSCTNVTLEEINGVTFCILCGLETDYHSYPEHPQNKEPRGLTFKRASTREQRNPVPMPPPENVNTVSKYEKARIIGVRARQIADGAQPRCSVEGLTSSLDIATREFEQGLTVFKRRSETRPKKKYKVSPSEADLLTGEKTEDERLRNEILRHLGLLDE